MDTLLLPHGAEQGGPGVVHRDKGVGQGGEQEVDQGAVHHRRLHPAEDEQQDMLAQHKGQHHEHGGDKHHRVEQLPGGRAGVLLLPPAQVLGDHHRPAGGQGGEDLDDQQVEVVHQGHPGHGSLPAGGDHDGVRHAHGHQQQLLNDQGDDQPQ